MAYTPYYAPYYRPMNYYNPVIPQDNQNVQNGQPFSQPIQQQQMPVQQPIQPMQVPTPTNDMIWVLSEVEAQSYPVAPNNSVILWDKNNDVVYIKSVNMQGVPSMRVLDYKERTPDNAPKTPVEHKCQCGDKFVLKKDFEALQSEFEALRTKIETISVKPKTKTAKVIVEDENDG